MDFKRITKALSALSQLSAEDYDLTIKLHESSESDREALIVALGPQSAKKKSTKKSSTTTKPATKSARAQSLQGAIQKTPKVVDGTPCSYRYPDDAPAYAGQTCTAMANNVIHDPAMGYAGYHEFQPAQTQAASGD